MNLFGIDIPDIVQQGQVIVPHKRPLVGFRLLSQLCATATAFLNLKVIGGKFYISGRNAIIDVTGATTPDGSQPSTAQSRSFIITGQGDEYLTGSYGGLEVAVYKPHQFRPSIYTDQHWLGRNKKDGVHAYTYDSLDSRIDGYVLGGKNKTFKEVIWPEYFDGDIVTAVYVPNIKPTDPNGSDAFIWQDVNEAGRQWGWIDTICYGGATRSVVSLGSKPY